MSYVRLGLLSAFSLSAVYSLYHLLAPGPGKRGARSRVAPTLTEAAVATIVAEVRSSVAQLCEECFDALRMYRDRPRDMDVEEYATLEDEARSEVQAAVAAAEAAALAARGLTASEYEHASAYYTTGSGRSTGALHDAIVSLRKCSGRFFVTKASVLDVMRLSYVRHAEAVKEKLLHAFEMGLIRDPRHVPAFCSSPGFNDATLQSSVEKLFMDHTGMSATELKELCNSPRFVEVSEAQERTRTQGPPCTQRTQAHNSPSPFQLPPPLHPPASHFQDQVFLRSLDQCQEEGEHFKQEALQSVQMQIHEEQMMHSAGAGGGGGASGVGL